SPAGLLGESPEVGGLVECAGRQTRPGGRRPQLREHQERQVIAAVVIHFDVQAAGRLGDRGEYLESDVACDQARDVHVAATAMREEISAPEQRIGMQVRNEEFAMERLRGGGGGVGRRMERAVHVALYHGGNNSEEQKESGDE